MFTGLIEGLGRVEAVTRKGPDAVLAIRAPFDLSEVAVGDSIAVSGVCLTATSLSGSVFRADVSAETLSRSTLGSFKPGSVVNLERALRLGDRLDGHLVSGHIDCQGKLLAKEDLGASIRLSYGLPEEVMRYIIEKGSVAIDGVSLTVNQVSRTGFEVNIIPTTASKTSLGLNKPGEMVNIETDLIGKYVESLLSPLKPGKKGLTMDRLAELGFFDK